MRHNWRVLLALVGILAMLAAGCGNAPGEEGTGQEAAAEEGEGEGEGDALSGAIEVDGSSTVEPLTNAVAEEYAAEQPDVRVNVGVSGTGGGFERFCAGETDISDASRAIEEDEVALCEEAGIEFTELQVGVDALAVVTNPETDWVECLTIDELTTIFGPDDPASNWSEVNSEFPDEPLEVFAPGTDSGTYDFMVEDVLGLEESRQDYNASEDDNVIVTGIQGTPGSWGFFGFAFFQANEDSLKALEVDGGEGCVAPTLETAQDESYPLIRPLFIYVKNESYQRPEVADFVDYYIETVNGVIESVGYVPMPEDRFAETQSNLESLQSGGGSTGSEG
ncbi:MAG: PstS family phosphate ABC transporter substrate-binding protein [Actinomycetota bacterium]|nr:PstS family phosphate ABC transporter substrate-binding protein [Actinomycetota bacterium]